MGAYAIREYLGEVAFRQKYIRMQIARTISPMLINCAVRKPARKTLSSRTFSTVKRISQVAEEDAENDADIDEGRVGSYLEVTKLKKYRIQGLLLEPSEPAYEKAFSFLPSRFAYILAEESGMRNFVLA